MPRPIPSNPVFRALDVARIWLATAASSRRERDLFAHVRSYVSFIGHSRSGHSVVGALLDAHPNAVIAHEEGTLQYVNVGFDRWRIFSRLHWNAREVGHSQTYDRKRRNGGYTYDVEGQWQGRADRIEVIGDKHGEYNSVRFGTAPRLMSRLRRIVDVPTRYVHVVRNPFDNISTMARRAVENGRTERLDLEAAIERYAFVSAHAETVRRRVEPDALYTLRHEDFVAVPAAELAALCRWLDLEPSPEYLEACTATVYESPHASRHKVTWSDAHRCRVEALIAETPFLRGYTFEA